MKGSFVCSCLISADTCEAKRNSAARLPSGANAYSPVALRDKKSREQRSGGRRGGGGEGDSVAVAAAGAASKVATTIEASARKVVAAVASGI